MSDARNIDEPSPQRQLAGEGPETRRTPSEPVASSQVTGAAARGAGPASDRPYRGSGDELSERDGLRVERSAEEPPVGWQAPLLDLASTVARRWQLFAIVVMLGVSFGIARYLMTRPYYAASAAAMLLAREKPPLDLRIRNGVVETSSDTATRGDTGAMMLPANVALYTSIARSNAVLASVARRFLPRLERIERVRPEEAVATVRDMLTIHGDENGFVSVDVIAHDPALAADVANAIVDEINEATNQIEAGLLTKQCEHLTDTIREAETRMSTAERALEDFVQTHGIVDLHRQTGDVLGLLREAETRKQGLVQERLELLATYTDRSPTVRALDERIATVAEDIRRLRERARGFGIDDTVSGTATATLELELERLRKDVDLERDLLVALRLQRTIYEHRRSSVAAAIAAARKADPEPLRAGPSKKNTIGASVLIALFLAVLVVVIREQWTRVEREPYLARRADEVKAQVRVLAPAWMLAAARRVRGRPS